jgi:hypothetical protein
MAVSDIGQIRGSRAADFLLAGTAGVKMTSGRRTHGTGHIPFQDNSLSISQIFERMESKKILLQLWAHNLSKLMYAYIAGFGHSNRYQNH